MEKEINLEQHFSHSLMTVGDLVAFTNKVKKAWDKKTKLEISISTYKCEHGLEYVCDAHSMVGDSGNAVIHLTQIVKIK